VSRLALRSVAAWALPRPSATASARLAKTTVSHSHTVIVQAIRDETAFAWTITVWLWLTVVFANLAEAVAEGRGKAQAATLRRAKRDTVARRLAGWAPGKTVAEEGVPASQLQQGDHVVVESGEIIPGDGDVVEGIASVDESAITGESAPVIRESGGDRSAVTGGTKVLSDRIVVRITQNPGQSFVDKMIALVEGANRQKTPNEIALNILLASLSIVFLLAVATLQPLAIFAKASQPSVPDTSALDGNGVTGIVMVSLLVCLIPTTIGALLSAIGIAGMDRLVQPNVAPVDKSRSLYLSRSHVRDIQVCVLIGIEFHTFQHAH
jgi:K+-transporting ATPase ATPase B chain